MLQLLPEHGGPSNQSGISVAVDGPRSLAPWLAMQTPDVLGTMAVGMVNVTPVAQTARALPECLPTCLRQCRAVPVFLRHINDAQVRALQRYFVKVLFLWAALRNGVSLRG